MVVQVIYVLSYIVLQVVPKVLPRTQTMISTVDKIPENRVTAYNILETLPEPYFEVYKALGSEAMTLPINPDRRSLTNLLKNAPDPLKFDVTNISSGITNHCMER